jgi:nucleoside-diphosphate-sugar epimerase
MAILVFGCGYLGRRVAERWRAAGKTVHVVTRSSQHAADFRKQGFLPIVADVVRPATLVDLPAAATVFYAVGFDRTAGVSIHDVYVQGLTNVLAALPESTQKIVYASSTGVYGQDDGDWVDEQSPCEPRRDAGRACLAAEQLLAAHRLGHRSVVLRMAGLYGPGRVPRERDLRAGAPLPVPADGYLNLIHVDDAAAVVLAAERLAPTPRMYLVADGHPVVRREYYAELARLVGAPPPRFETPAADNPALLRSSADKRVKNDRLLAELEVRLFYPSYREGLAAILAAERAKTASS